jgi:hypothetical protein
VTSRWSVGRLEHPEPHGPDQHDDDYEDPDEDGPAGRRSVGGVVVLDGRSLVGERVGSEDDRVLLRFVVSPVVVRHGVTSRRCPVPCYSPPTTVTGVPNRTILHAEIYEAG